MSFSELLDRIGVLMLASQNLLQNFTARIPDHHCQMRIMANYTHRANLPASLNAEEMLRVSIPMDRSHKPEKCQRFVTTQWQFLNPNATSIHTIELDTEPCVDGWTYDKRLFGWKALLIWCYLQMAVTGICAAFSPNFTMYCVFPFLTGLAISGISVNSVSLCIEWIPTNVWAIVGTINGYSYTTGQFILAGVAYAIPDWRWLQLTVSLPFFVFFLYSWYSACWLVISGKPEQAVKGLRKVARINGKMEEGDKLSTQVLKSNMQKELSSAKSSHTITDLVCTPTMRKISCGVSCIWFSTSFSYYSLAMDLQNFNVNAFSLVLAGLHILANIFVPQELQTLCMVFAVIGKGSLAASLNCAYIFSGELFQMVIRYLEASTRPHCCLGSSISKLRPWLHSTELG
uniref:Uncharacterized protein n=1 Tax=Chelonoidis abingdonii TaxID=106734 RepID=A0A8C0G0C8_CHEAB